MKKKIVEMCWSRDEENFQYDDIHELLASEDVGGDWGLNVGDTVYYGEKEHPEPTDYFDVDSLLEEIGNRAYDECGEWAEDYPDVDKKEVEKLDKYIKRWLKKNCQPTFWIVRNVKPYELKAEDMDLGAAK